MQTFTQESATLPAVQLAAQARSEANRYAALGTDAGNLFAETMNRLAELLEWTGAGSADEHAVRMEVWEATVLDGFELFGRNTAEESLRRLPLF